MIRAVNWLEVARGASEARRRLAFGFGEEQNPKESGNKQVSLNVSPGPFVWSLSPRDHM